MNEVKLRKDISAAATGQFQLDLDKCDDMMDLNKSVEFEAEESLVTPHRRSATVSLLSTGKRLSSYKRILAVDDSKLIRRMVSRSLITRGYEVDEAEDGIEALEKMSKSSCCCSSDTSNSDTAEGMTVAAADSAPNDFSTSTYDVILMDSEMPRMSGPEATEFIRAHGYKGVIMALTGNVSQEEEDLFMSKGATRVLFKPVDIVQLDQALKEVEEESLRNKSTSSNSSLASK